MRLLRLGQSAVPAAQRADILTSIDGAAGAISM
jgi:hypothetical protein